MKITRDEDLFIYFLLAIALNYNIIVANVPFVLDLV